jgi:hypothetical protein
MVVFMAVTWFIADIGRKESEDEYISGMQLTDKPAEVNKLLRKNGELSDLRVGDLHMVRMAEVLNFLMHGTIGVGKSTLIRWLLDYIRKRGDRAIIYDSGCTFTETHYNPDTDFILNAHDERCANWQMWGSVSMRSTTTTWPPASFRWKASPIRSGYPARAPFCRPRHSHVG